MKNICQYSRGFASSLPPLQELRGWASKCYPVKHVLLSHWLRYREREHLNSYSLRFTFVFTRVEYLQLVHFALKGTVHFNTRDLLLWAYTFCLRTISSSSTTVTNLLVCCWSNFMHESQPNHPSFVFLLLFFVVFFTLFMRFSETTFNLGWFSFKLTDFTFFFFINEGHVKTALETFNHAFIL